jgi:hypothetical protein
MGIFRRRPKKKQPMTPTQLGELLGGEAVKLAFTGRNSLHSMLQERGVSSTDDARYSAECVLFTAFPLDLAVVNDCDPLATAAVRESMRKAIVRSLMEIRLPEGNNLLVFNYVFEHIDERFSEYAGLLSVALEAEESLAMGGRIDLGKTAHTNITGHEASLLESMALLPVMTELVKAGRDVVQSVELVPE